MPSPLARFFTNPESGDVVIAQRPNLPLGIFLVVTVVRLLFHPEGTAGTAITVIGAAALLVWAGLEVVRGDSPFRRVLGAVVVIFTVAGIVTR